MLVSEILRIKGTHAVHDDARGHGARRRQGDGAARHRLAGRDGPRPLVGHAHVSPKC